MMPDGPRYEDDFYAWTQYQAEVLRNLRTRDNRFDRNNLVEEIDSLGRSERDAVRSRVERVLVHFLKLACSPAREPRFDWMRSVVEARSALENKLSPSLRRDAEERLARLYVLARKQAELDLLKYHEDEAAQCLPPECPYTLDQILAEDLYPEPVASTKGEAE